MTRLGSLVFCAALGFGIALAGCGSNTNSGGAPSAMDAVPRGNGVAGWAIDPENTKAADKVAASATDLVTCTDLIDGAASDIYGMSVKPSLFLWQTYVNSALSSPTPATISLYVMQFADAAQAATFYTEILTGNLWAEKPWTDPSDPAIGSHSRIQDTGDHWWINFTKDNFYVEVSMKPSYNPAPPYTAADPTMKTAAVTFAQAVAAKL